MRDTLRVAAIQCTSTAGDIAANATTAIDAIHAAANEGARVVVFPELFLCGYTMDALSINADDSRLEPLRVATSETGVVAIMGAALTQPTGEPTIGLLIIDTEVRHVYDKQYLCGDERDHFAAGHAGTILEVDGWQLGLAVCYDGCFPQHARATADAGAEVYVAAIAYVEGSAHRRDLYYRARALDNGMYAVVSGLTGECGGAQFNGGSAVIDPEGRVVDVVADEATGMVIATLRRSVIEATRRAHSMGVDHRSDVDVVHRITTG